MHNLPVVMQITFAFTLIYIWCLAALKLSQLALYHRVFQLQLRLAVYIVGGIVVAWAIIFNFVFIHIFHFMHLLSSFIIYILMQYFFN